jgi:hypothetical protein
MYRLGIRGQEIKDINKKNIKQTTVSNKKEYYLDMRPKDFTVDPASGNELFSIGTGKPNTSKAYVYVPKKLAESLIKYLEKNKFEDKEYVTAIGKKITLSNNKVKKYNDLRSRIETLALQKHPELLPQLKYVLRHDKTTIDKNYLKMGAEEAIEMQIKMHEKLGLGKKTTEKPELPTPPKETQRDVIDKIRETKAIHKRIRTKKDILEQYQPQNQKEIILQKDLIIDALEGAQQPKPSAISYLKRFIRSHERAIQEIKSKPTKEFPPLFGDTIWHQSQIANYKKALELLKSSPKEGFVEIGSFRSEGKAERRKLRNLIKKEQKYLGVERKQIGDKAYEREMRELTKNGLGYEDPVSSIKQLETVELYDFLNLLRSTDYSKAGAKFKAAETSVKKMAKERNIDKNQLKQMLLELGVKDGKFENVKHKQVLNYLKGAIAEHSRSKFEPSASDHIVTFLTKGLVKFPGTFRRTFTPLYALLKNPKIGGEVGSKIADSFLNFDVTQSIINGQSSRVFVKIRGLLGEDAHMLQFSDKEKRKIWKKEMTPEEIEFVKKMDTKGTKEYEAAQMWDNLRRDLYNKIEIYAQKFTNKAIREQLTEKMDRMFVDDYFTRRVSKEFLEILPELDTQPFYEKLFNENMKSYVRGKVNKMKQRKNC